MSFIDKQIDKVCITVHDMGSWSNPPSAKRQREATVAHRLGEGNAELGVRDFGAGGLLSI